MIGSLMMCVSVVILLIGMLAGIVMGIQQDFALAPAHAHLNLVGGVLLFLFGLYYRLVPAAGTSALAKVQGWLHIVGAHPVSGRRRARAVARDASMARRSPARSCSRDAFSMVVFRTVCA